MVAYCFEKQFAALIPANTGWQSMYADKKGHRRALSLLEYNTKEIFSASHYSARSCDAQRLNSKIKIIWNVFCFSNLNKGAIIRFVSYKTINRPKATASPNLSDTKNGVPNSSAAFHLHLRIPLDPLSTKKIINHPLSKIKLIGRTHSRIIKRLFSICCLFAQRPRGHQFEERHGQGSRNANPPVTAVGVNVHRTNVDEFDAGGTTA